MKHLTDHNYCYFCGRKTKRRGWSSFECWHCKSLSQRLKEFIKLLHAIDWAREPKDADDIWEGFLNGDHGDRFIVYDRLDGIRHTLSTQHIRTFA